MSEAGAKFSLLGQQAKFYLLKTGAGILVSLYLSAFFATTTFLFFLDSDDHQSALILIFCVFTWWYMKFVMKLAVEHQEFFQNSEAWYDYQELLEGSKNTGLNIVSQYTELAQPVPLVEGQTVAGLKLKVSDIPVNKKKQL